MKILRLDIDGLRCIRHERVEAGDGVQFLLGANGAGKTTVLEALHLLGYGRSFRSGQRDAVIQRGAQESIVFADVERERGGRSRVGLRRAASVWSARIDESDVAGLVDLFRVCPVVCFEPGSHALIAGASELRRAYLDWSVFHVEPDFLSAWRRHQRALKQRNAALRAEAPEQVVRAWDPELLESGRSLAASRRGYFAHLVPHVAAVGEQLLGTKIELSLSDGWLAGTELKDAIEHSWPRDRERGTTHIGPHRADLSIRVGGDLAKHRVSRGQQKLTASAMLLGQLLCDHALGSPTAALLVDDPAAELDEGNLERLISVVLALPGQLFVSALDPGMAAFQRLPVTRRFHVEHGKITPLL